MNFKKLFKQIGAVGGLTGGVGILIAILSGGGAPPEAFIFLTTFLGIGGRSTQLLLQEAKKEKELTNLQQTKRILQAISSNYGKVSLAELVMKMEIPLPELKGRLDELQRDGMLGIEVSNSGEVL